MPIPSVRFKDLSKDFNIASSSFASLRDEAILNIPEVNIDDLTESAKSLLDQLKELNQDAQSGLGAIKDVVADATRVTQNVFDTFMDLSKLPEAMIGDLISDIIPGEMSSLTNSLKSMTKVCRNNGLGSGLGFKNNGIGNCSGMNIGFNNCSSSAGGVLGKSLLGGIGELLNGIGNIIGKVMSLANIGFNANLCKILGGLLDGIGNKSIIGTTIGLLANQQGIKGNLNALFDIGSTAAGFGMSVAKGFPSTTSNIVKGVTSYGLNFQNAKSAMFDRLEGTIETLDPGWMSAGVGSISLSVEKFSDASSEILGSVSDRLKNVDFDMDNLDLPMDNDEGYTALLGSLDTMTA